METRDMDKLRSMSPEERERELDRLEAKLVASRKHGQGPKEGRPVPALRLVRIFNDLTALELAQKSGVGRQTIARLEDGGGARPDTISKLAKALDVEEETLYRDWDSEEVNEEVE